MKSKEDLELTVLKHIITDETAMHKIVAIGIKPEHFTYVAPMQKMCYPRQIFKIATRYYEDSNGSLLTHNVLTNQLQKSQIDESHKSQIELNWQLMQDFDTDPNDLHDLLMQLKHN